MQIDLENLDAFAMGCAFLGCGGGGDVIAAQALRYAIERFGPVPVLDLAELPKDALVMPCADMGAPTVFFEKVANGGEGALLREEVERIFGRKVFAVLPAEIGGSNGLTPVGWAARLGLPIVDADGIGRAYPEVNMIALELAGVAISPGVVADERGNVVTIRAVDGAWMERVARSVTVAFGGSAAFAAYPLDAGQAVTSAVLGSVSQAIRIGSALKTVDGDPTSALCELLGAVEVLRGKVTDIDRRIEGGFVLGSVTLDGLGPDSGRQLRIEYQNEFLMAFEQGRPLAMVPDLISMLDVYTGEAVSTERMRYGLRVSIVALPAPAIWRSKMGLALGGPRAFGYEIDYVPVEDLYASAT